MCPMTDMQALQRTLGERLVKIRTVRGMTQQQMADALGIGKRNLVRYENDQADPPLAVLKRYASAFDVPMSWIVEEGGPAITRAATGRYSRRFAALVGNLQVSGFRHPALSGRSFAA